MSSEFRRGWSAIVAAAAGVGMGVTGLPFYTFGLFIAPIGAEFGWSRADISLGSLCLTGVTFIMAPVIGAIADRMGPRRIGLVSLIGLSIGYPILTLIVDSPVTWYLSWALIALLGSGTAAMVWTKVVALWFVEKRGFALALTLVGTGIAGALGPLMVNALTAQFGWRAGFYGLSAVTLFFAVPLVAMWFRAPGAGDIAQCPDEATAHVAQGPTLKSAIREIAFWRIGIGFLLVSLGVAATIVHLVPMLIDRGITPGEAASIAGVMGLSVIIGRLGCGFLVDRFNPSWVAAIMLMMPACGSIGLALGGNAFYLVIPAALSIGLAAGAEVDLVAYLTARQFGLRAFGAILGCELALFGLGAALGPVILGRLHDQTGGYQSGLLLFAASYLIGAFLIAGIRAPVEPARMP